MDDMHFPTGRPTVVLAEDHPNVAKAIEGLLREEFDVIGVVGNGIALVSLVEILRPDAVVTDIGMPGMDGIEAARRLARSHPHMPVVFVSCHDDLGIARMALEIGCGYVVKASAGEDLLDAVHAVLRGDSYVSCSLRHV
ncbi:MAG: response regulator transcription factor [Luteibacter sp.]